MDRRVLLLFAYLPELWLFLFPEPSAPSPELWLFPFPSPLLPAPSSSLPMPSTSLSPLAGRGQSLCDGRLHNSEAFDSGPWSPHDQGGGSEPDSIELDCHYTFIVLQDHIREYAVDQALKTLVPGCSVVTVDRVTEGAACTVLLARDLIDNDSPLMMANSDQFVDVDINTYLAAQEQQDLDGLIMTFWADHPKWSYCRMGQGGMVTEVLEKQVVSNEATVGIYNFRRGKDFVKAADKMIALDKRVNGEFYVAPVYNELIR